MSTAVVASIMVGVAIGGVVAGGIELVMQIATKGIDNINLGSIAIETFTGAAFGAIAGASSSTTSAGFRLGLRFTNVGISALNTTLHGINDKKDFGTIMNDVTKSGIFSSIFQVVFLGLDYKIGKVSSSVLELYYLDSKLAFGAFKISFLIATLIIKNIIKNCLEV